MIRVYQPISKFNELPEARRADVMFQTSWEKVKEAACCFAYAHAANVATDDANEVFEITNGFGDKDKLEVVGPMRSGSVGDVLIVDGLGGDRVGYICAPLGWIEMTVEQVKWWESWVPAVMKMGDPA